MLTYISNADLHTVPKHLSSKAKQVFTRFSLCRAASGYNSIDESSSQHVSQVTNVIVLCALPYLHLFERTTINRTSIMESDSAGTGVRQGIIRKLLLSDVEKQKTREVACSRECVFTYREDRGVVVCVLGFRCV